MFVLRVLMIEQHGPLLQKSSQNFKAFNEVITPTKLELSEAIKI